MPDLHFSGFRLWPLDLVLPPIAWEDLCYSTPIQHLLPAGLPQAWVTLVISFLYPEMLPEWKVRASDFRLTFWMPGSEGELLLSCITILTPCSSCRQTLPPALPVSVWLLPWKHSPLPCCPQGMQAAQQPMCPDGLIQFDFFLPIYSSFLESIFHWRLPEWSKWHVHARLRVGLQDGLHHQPLLLPPALQCAVPALRIHAVRAGGISAFVEWASGNVYLILRPREWGAKNNNQLLLHSSAASWGVCVGRSRHQPQTPPSNIPLLRILGLCIEKGSKAAS